MVLLKKKNYRFLVGFDKKIKVVDPIKFVVENEFGEKWVLQNGDQTGAE